MDRLPPNYGKVGGYPEDLDTSSCSNYLFLRIHYARCTCNRYLAYIRINFICDDWQKRPEVLGLDKLELREEELTMRERQPVRDLQRPFAPKD